MLRGKFRWTLASGLASPSPVGMVVDDNLVSTLRQHIVMRYQLSQEGVLTPWGHSQEGDLTHWGTVKHMHFVWASVCKMKQRALVLRFQFVQGHDVLGHVSRVADSLDGDVTVRTDC